MNHCFLFQYLYYHLSLFNESILTDPVFLYIITRTARPTVISAAATAITKNTNTCPDGSPWCLEKATIKRFTEFNMSSIDINMIIILRLTKMPIIPIENKIEQRII